MKNFITKFSIVAFTFCLMSVNPSVNMSVEDGRASDCVRMARTAVLITADELGEDPNGVNFPGYLDLYNRLYTACYNS